MEIPVPGPGTLNIEIPSEEEADNKISWGFETPQDKWDRLSLIGKESLARRQDMEERPFFIPDTPIEGTLGRGNEHVVPVEGEHCNWMLRALTECQSEAGVLGPNSALVNRARHILGRGDVLIESTVEEGDILEFVHNVGPGESNERWAFEWIGHVWQLKTYSIAPLPMSEDEEYHKRYMEAPDLETRVRVDNCVVRVDCTEYHQVESMRSAPMSLDASCSLRQLAAPLLPNPPRQGDRVMFVDARPPAEEESV